MSPSNGKSAQETSTMSAVPGDATVFTGQWIDSLGNDVYVELVDGTPRVTLMKSSGGRPLELWLRFDYRVNAWICGNGLMSETVFGPDKSDKAKKAKVVLQFASWVTKDGRVSSWTRAHHTSTEAVDSPSSTEAVDSPASSSEDTDAPTLPKGRSIDQTAPWKQYPWKAPRPLSAEAAPKPPALQAPPTLLQTIKASGPESECQLPKTSRFARSWYEETEEFDELQAELTRGPDKHVEASLESGPAVTETKEWKPRRRGRRGGRGTRRE